MMKKITLNQLKSSKFGFLSSVLLILLGFVFTNSIAQQRTLLALSKNDHTLAIVDAVTLKVLARVPVGSDPHEVIASADGKTAYVSIYGGGSLHEINVIDLVSQKPLFTIDTKPMMGPHGLTFAAGKLWFSAEGTKTVGRFDPFTSKLDWCMGTGQDRTHMVYVTENGKEVYTTNVSSGSVSILVDSLIKPKPFPSGFTPPPHQDWVQFVLPVSKGSEGFDVTPDGRQLWTASADDGSIAVIDLVARKVTATIDAKAIGANRLKFTPDGKLALISSLRTGDLFVIDVATHKEVKHFNIARGGAGILIDPDGARAFVGCTGDNYVAVIDMKTLTVISHLDVGGGPDGLAWAIRQ